METVTKQYITPDELRRDSFLLGAKVLRDGFRPDFMVALWRGGAPVGMYLHELLAFKGLQVDHVAIRTSRYHGVDKASEGEVVVHSTTYLRDSLRPGSSVLLVDGWRLVLTRNSRLTSPARRLGFRHVDCSLL